VSFVAENLEATPPHKEALQRAGVEVLHWPEVDDIDRHLREHGHTYDIVMLSRAEVAAAHIDAVRTYCPGALAVFDTVDLHFLREQRRAALAAAAGKAASTVARIERKARKLEAIETGVMRKADVTLVVSETEKELLDSEHPGLVPALPDNDIVGIDAVSHAILPGITHGVGTTLLDIERNPVTGDLWVTGTEAHNRVRFEPAISGSAPISGVQTSKDTTAPSCAVLKSFSAAVQAARGSSVRDITVPLS